MSETLSKYKKILLVDDDPEDQEIFYEVLTRINTSLDCSFADTGEDAISTLLNTEDKPGIIFLDLNLPYMSGFDCLYKIKLQPQLQNIPVIIYSTSSRDSDKQKARDLGAIQFISKPDSFAELQSVLRGIFI